MKIDLNDFQPAERKLLVSLLYRIGAWIGETEDEQGDRDDRKEHKALESIIRAVAHANGKSPLVQAMAKECFVYQNQWQEWGKRDSNILKDCATAIGIMKAKTSETDVRIYKAALFRIAEAVASAYGEFGEDLRKDEGIVGRFLEKMGDAVKKPLDGDNGFLNIAPAEQEALSQLKAVLTKKDL
jgi:hypothetical protein